MSRKILVALCVICVATILIHMNTGAEKWTAVLLLCEGMITVAAAIRAIIIWKRGKKR